MKARRTVVVRKSDGTPKRVPCFPTSHPYFVINPEVTWNWSGQCLVKRNLYTLTHTPTGFAVVHNARSKRVLRKVAGAMMGIPLDWKKLTRRKAINSLRRLPEPIVEWIESIRDEGL